MPCFSNIEYQKSIGRMDNVENYQWDLLDIWKYNIEDNV